MGIDKNTGLPEGMTNRSPLIDRIKAVTEGSAMALQGEVPLNNIETLILKPETAERLLA